jgi:ABC-2 type transport system permease protein
MGLLSLLLLFLVAGFKAHIILAPGIWLLLIIVLLLGTIPFILLGFGIGSLASPSVAPAVANIIYMPLSFASGLLIPLPSLPGFVQTLAPYLPGYQIGQLGHMLIGVSAGGSIWPGILWLDGYTLLFAVFALYAYRVDQVRNYV